MTLATGGAAVGIGDMQEVVSRRPDGDALGCGPIMLRTIPEIGHIVRTTPLCCRAKADSIQTARDAAIGQRIDCQMALATGGAAIGIGDVQEVVSRCPDGDALGRSAIMLRAVPEVGHAIRTTPLRGRAEADRIQTARDAATGRRESGQIDGINTRAMV